MKENEIIEGNQLIAKFMEYDDVDCQHCKYTRDCNWLQCGLTKEEKLELLVYNASWDWLIPVVEKIESLGYDVFITGLFCRITDSGLSNFEVESGEVTSKIESVYTTIIEFIKWYNENKSK